MKDWIPKAARFEIRPASKFDLSLSSTLLESANLPPAFDPTTAPLLGCVPFVCVPFVGPVPFVCVWDLLSGRGADPVDRLLKIRFAERFKQRPNKSRQELFN